ncbi:MAG: hypothetical protein M3Y82_15190, partial [Verrucomicrobiota bacterium]|nr:hypothetical protein [Verrucomicrobiota bacterium]
TRAKGPWTLAWQSKPMVLSQARSSKDYSSDKKAERVFIESLDLSARQFHNPAGAGPWVQIPPPQPI